MDVGISGAAGIGAHTEFQISKIGINELIKESVKISHSVDDLVYIPFQNIIIGVDKLLFDSFYNSLYY
ncbi:MAG: hypothetical protein MJ232_05470 [archaeon]|nr:hypothetical protein [archaeon]